MLNHSMERWLDSFISHVSRKKVSMKKEDFSGIIVYILILALAVVFGLTVLQSHANAFENTFIYVLFVVGGIASKATLTVVF